MSTFNEIRRATNNMAKDVAELTGLEVSFVLNVIQYARRLCHPSQPDLIEELVFIAQMSCRFDITSMLHVKLMFDAVKIRDTRVVQVEEFVKMVCTFCCTKLDVKIDMVYLIYDFNKDHQIDQQEIKRWLQNSIMCADIEDSTDQLKELVDIVLNVFDLDGDGQISLDEFRDLVHGNILYIEVLGKVLPHPDVVAGFMNDLKGKTPLAIRNKFTHERADCLFEPRFIEAKDDLYPVTLDLP